MEIRTILHYPNGKRKISQNVFFAFPFFSSFFMKSNYKIIFFNKKKGRILKMFDCFY